MFDHNREIFRRRIEKLLDTSNTSRPIELRNRVIERKILNIIIGYKEGGISHTDIAKIIGINRKNVTKYLRSLQDRNLVRRGIGKHGRYFATESDLVETDLSAEVFANLFTVNVLSPDDNDLYKTKIEVKSPYIVPRLPYEDPDYDLDLERIIFDFSNTVGAFITYVLIQSMNQTNNITALLQDAKDKDLVIQKWIGDLISELQYYLLPIFRDYIQIYIPTFIDRCKKDGINQSILNYMFQQPRYVFDNSIISDLSSAYSHAYPNLYQTLEKIRKKWPRVVQQEKDENQYLCMRHETQMRCKHKYVECEAPIGAGLIPTITRTVHHCKKCQRR